MSERPETDNLIAWVKYADHLEASLAAERERAEQAIEIAEGRRCLCGRLAATATGDCDRCMSIIATTRKAPPDTIRVLAEFVLWMDDEQGKPTVARRQASSLAVKEFLQQRLGHEVRTYEEGLELIRHQRTRAENAESDLTAERVENERLKGALERIADTPALGRAEEERYVEVARAALKGSSDE